MEKRARQMRILLVGSTLVMGTCGLIYEYVLSVLGNHLLGSSYEEIFIVIGIMMFAMGLGAGFQRYVKSDLFEKFLLLEILLGLTGGQSPSCRRVPATALAQTGSLRKECSRNRKQLRGSKPMVDIQSLSRSRGGELTGEA